MLSDLKSPYHTAFILLDEAIQNSVYCSCVAITAIRRSCIISTDALTLAFIISSYAIVILKEREDKKDYKDI